MCLGVCVVCDSSPSLPQLVTECRDTLEWALRVREEFAEMIEQAMQGSVVLSGRLNAVCEAFETDLGDVFNVSCLGTCVHVVPCSDCCGCGQWFSDESAVTAMRYERASGAHFPSLPPLPPALPGLPAGLGEDVISLQCAACRVDHC